MDFSFDGTMLLDDMLKEGTLSGDWTDDDFAKLKEACQIVYSWME